MNVRHDRPERPHADACHLPVATLTHTCRAVAERYPGDAERRLLRSAIRGYVMCARTERLPADQVLSVLRTALGMSGLAPELRTELVTFGVDAYYGFSAHGAE